MTVDNYFFAAGQPAPAEGETCGLCKRRVPHARKPSSPKSSPFSYRVPEGEDKAAHRAVLEAAAEHLGVSEQPFRQFKVMSIALALVLQDESLKGFGAR